MVAVGTAVVAGVVAAFVEAVVAAFVAFCVVGAEVVIGMGVMGGAVVD